MHLSIGKKCFFKGKHYEIVGAYDEKHWTAVLLGQPISEVVVLPKRKVEPLITEMFTIGDPVRSHHSFRGRVTGFEILENRAICVSERIEGYVDLYEPASGSRTRWSYGFNEIVLHEEAIAHG